MTRNDMHGRGVCYVASPCHSDRASLKTADCFLRLQNELGWPVQRLYSQPTDAARNLLARQLLSRADMEIVLFIDSDMIFTPHDAREVASLAGRYQGVVAGLYCTRMMPHLPAVRGENAQEDVLKGVRQGGTLVEVEGAGTGFMAIHRSIFERLKFPWFKWPVFEDGTFITDDYYFCERVRRELDEPIRVDTGVRLGHVSERVVVLEDYLELKDQPRWVKWAEDRVLRGEGMARDFWDEECAK
jgi:hypothetical protein